MKHFATIFVLAILFTTAQAQAQLLDSAVGIDVGVTTTASTSAGIQVDSTVNTDTTTEINANAFTSSAQAVMASDENVDAVASDESHIEVTYQVPSKFLGLFSANINATAEVDFESKNEVTVRYPWYRFLFSVDDRADADTLEAKIRSRVDDEVSVSGEITARNSAVIRSVSSIMKSTRASIEAEANAEANASY